MYSSIYKIIAVTETWLHNQILDNEILPTNYVIYQTDRDSRGGGVMLAIHESLQSKLLISPLNLEVLTVQVSSGATAVIVCVVYIPPKEVATSSDDILVYLKSISHHGSIIILGALISRILIEIILLAPLHFQMIL